MYRRLSCSWASESIVIREERVTHNIIYKEILTTYEVIDDVSCRQRTSPAPPMPVHTT